MIKIKTTDGKSMGGYFVAPATTPAPGVLLIQEIFGVNKTMRKIADDYAGRGFAVLCPDLFFREQGEIQLDDCDENDRQRAFELYEKLDEPQAVADCGAALSVL